MADTYTALARVYKQGKFAAEGEQLRPRLLNKIQSEGWLGRRILDLGCGIGETSCWFSENGFRVIGVDQSEAMLEEARALAESHGVGVNWRHDDIRRMEIDGDYDLVLCWNTLNEMRSLHELEAVFRLANRALAVDKLLIFDLVTIQGLAERWGDGDYVLFDDPDNLIVLARSRYSYETSVNTRAYIIFRRDDEGWHRDDETHVLRGFSMKAVGTLLQRLGFKVENVVAPSFAPFDPYTDQTGRAIFTATKQKDLGEA